MTDNIVQMNPRARGKELFQVAQELNQYIAAQPIMATVDAEHEAYRHITFASVSSGCQGVPQRIILWLDPEPMKADWTLLTFEEQHDDYLIEIVEPQIVHVHKIGSEHAADWRHFTSLREAEDFILPIVRQSGDRLRYLGA